MTALALNIGTDGPSTVLSFPDLDLTGYTLALKVSGGGTSESYETGGNGLSVSVDGGDSTVTWDRTVLQSAKFGGSAKFDLFATSPGGEVSKISAGTITFAGMGQIVDAPAQAVEVPGLQGPPNVLAIGTVTTLAPGEEATAQITGVSPAQTLNLGLPQGIPGAIQSVNGDSGPDVVIDASDVGAQPVDALLTAISALSTVADRVIYATGSDTVSLTALTSFGRSVIAASDAAAARSTLAAAPLDSPAFTNTPTVPTATLGTNTTQAASTAFVQAAIDAIISGAPSGLNTLDELAAAIGYDASFATTITNLLAAKAPLSSPALTDTPTAPTASAATNTTQIATTAHVWAALNSLIGTIMSGASNNDVIQKISGSWTNRTVEQMLSALPLTYGTWTPTFSATGAEPTGITYSSQSGVYFRIKGIVFIVGTIAVSGWSTATGQPRLVGLPVTPVSNNVINSRCSGFTSSGPIHCLSQTNGTMTLEYVGSGGSAGAVSTAHLGASWSVAFGGAYLV